MLFDLYNQDHERDIIHSKTEQELDEGIFCLAEHRVKQYCLQRLVRHFHEPTHIEMYACKQFALHFTDLTIEYQSDGHV